MTKSSTFPVLTSLLAFGSASLLIQGAGGANKGSGQLSLRVLDAATDRTIACRVHLANAEGKPQLLDQLPSFRDHFCCDGEATLILPAGRYTYVIERGPEYERCEGAFELAGSSHTRIEKKLTHKINMASEGWWSGELHVHRPAKDIELLMQAEDLHVAPIITWWNRSNVWKGGGPPEKRVVRFDDNRFCDLLGGEDERNGGAFMYFNMREPIDITQAEPEYPCPLHFIELAKRQPGAWIDIEKPFWWDVPVALAYGYGDSIGLLNNHCWRSKMLDSEAWGKPRNKQQFPSPLGNGFWSQQIYYHILNTGIRIAPSAGSASGVLDNPVGYNRVYVYTGGDSLKYDQWWENLRQGMCFVTNGPLILPNVSGRKPGSVFTAKEDQPVELDVKIFLTSNDPIRCIQIVKNGYVERTVSYETPGKDCSLGTLRFAKSGWFLIRVLADVPGTFRFASTAPYYVEIGEEKHHLSRKSIQFFIDWVNERIDRIKIEDTEKLRQVLGYHNKARQFWQQKLNWANSD
jgi:hypothetical protein